MVSEFHKFLFDFLPPFHRGPVGFILQRLPLDLKLDDAPLQGVDLRGQAVQFDPSLDAASSISRRPCPGGTGR